MTDLRPDLRLLPTPAPAECPAPGCGLPATGLFGLCEPCERVYRCLLVLCDRLLDRDLARLEHTTPGLTGAVRASVTASRCAPGAALPTPLPAPAPATAPWQALLPMPQDVASVEDLLSELTASMRAAGAIT